MISDLSYQQLSELRYIRFNLERINEKLDKKEQMDKIKEMNKKETKCATLNHLRLKLLTLKTIIAHLSNNSLKNLISIIEVVGNVPKFPNFIRETSKSLL
jgi:hypothetical protein